MDTQRTMRLTWKFSRWIFHVGEGVQKWRFVIVRKPPGCCVIHGANAVDRLLMHRVEPGLASYLFLSMNKRQRASSTDAGQIGNRTKSSLLKIWQRAWRERARNDNGQIAAIKGIWNPRGKCHSSSPWSYKFLRSASGRELCFLRLINQGLVVALFSHV